MTGVALRRVRLPAFHASWDMRHRDPEQTGFSMPSPTGAVTAPQTVVVDNTPRVRRVLQAVSDHVGLSGRAFSELRLLDLACAHGQYALEFARRGATALGIEGRKAWVDHANLTRESSGFERLSFVQDDVRNLSRSKYGEFDIVLCLGLLYHLDQPDCFDMLKKIEEVCTGFAVIDTQIAISQSPQVDVSWLGRSYRGWRYREHSEDATPYQKEQMMGASLDNEFAFWLTRSSLLNALRHVGFTSVYECQNPVDCVYQGDDIKIHSNFVTMLAIKGEPVGGFFGMSPDRAEEDDWPEDLQKHHLVAPWSSSRT